MNPKDILENPKYASVIAARRKRLEDVFGKETVEQNARDRIKRLAIVMSALDKKD